MVGKGVEMTSSRIFHQCYMKCCKLQNLAPLSSVIPSSSGKVLDFCVDRVKYQDWPPILNSLSCDLSLHSVAMRCRQPIKTILEHIDCERLAKTVNKRSVILTKFMLTNVIEAVYQLLSNTTLLETLLLEGLPLKIPYLNPLSEGLLANNSLQHLYLPRCMIGDAGCLAVCKAVRCLPNILTLDLTGCELTPLGASYIADLVKYQKIHRYSENWVHTLRYRLPELDAMAGLRRITICANPRLGDDGVRSLLDVLADDLWIKALDVQDCGLTEQTADAVLQMMRSNTTLDILDLRHNPEISSESMAKVRAALRNNEARHANDARSRTQYSWLSAVSGLSNETRLVKSGLPPKTGATKERIPMTNQRPTQKYATKPTVIKKDKDYTESLEEQLREEISHRQQLEELNLQLVEQMKRLRQEHTALWANVAPLSGSEQSLEDSSRSGNLSSSSDSSTNIPIDQNTLGYIQKAFKDIYAFIKNNQCHGECRQAKIVEAEKHETEVTDEVIEELIQIDEFETNETRGNVVKKAQSSHYKITETVNSNKTTKSAHLLGDLQRETVETKPEMIEKYVGDSKNAHSNENKVVEIMMSAAGKSDKLDNLYDTTSPCSSSTVSDSSDTLVCGVNVEAINPRDAFSSDEEDNDERMGY